MSKLTMACLVSVFSLACGQVEQSHSSQTTSTDLSDQTRIEKLIANLSSEDQSEQAQRQLLEIANRSTADRDRVVQSLIAGVNTHEELRKQRLILGDSFNYWYHANSIFSALKATEAIDVMIDCIHCGNGMTGSLNVNPAFDALQAMGPLAIPKMSQALREHSQSLVRAHVALCLGVIGGVEARNVLRKALRTETDKYVVRYIKWGLTTLAQDHG